MATTYGNTGSMGPTGSMAGTTGSLSSTAGSLGREAGSKIEGAVDQVKHMAETGAERAADVKDRIKDKLIDAKDRLVDASGTVKDKLADAGGAVKDKLVDAKDVVLDRGGSTLSSARALIREHPFIAVGVAFGIGYIALRLIRR